MSDNGDDRSTQYNNAGVRLMAYGNHSAALELFRGALASKLTHERIMLHSGNETNAVGGQMNVDMDEDNVEEDHTDQHRCVSPDGSESSDNTPLRSPTEGNENLDSYLDILRNMDEQQRRNDSATASSSSSTLSSSFTQSTRILPSPSTFRPSDDGVSAVVLSTYRGYEPYLYRIPFVLPGCDLTPSPSPTSVHLAQSVSCRIVFNLGLIHQTVSRSSCKVASFYEIAATLLSSLPSEIDDCREVSALMTLLRIAILNNFGVWCFENGEGESMMNSFEQLVDTLEDDQDLIDPTVLRGVRANIQAFLTPHNGVSLAA